MRNLTKLGSYISNRIGKAIADYNLIENNDRILVAVSGGKDSLSLLKLLNERRRWAPIDYKLFAIHVETDFRCAGCAHTEELKAIFEKSDIPYRFEKINIRGKDKKVTCFWCSWNRRKAIFTSAERMGCAKIAFGHHQDDINETLLLNMFYHGEFSAMNPRQELFGGRITIIRPLCYVSEDALSKFAKESKFPSQLCRCPNSRVSKRRMVKDFINRIEKDCPYVKLNIFRSIGRVNEEYTQINKRGLKDPSPATPCYGFEAGSGSILLRKIEGG
jgi:tRNA 2-thiocytidine biosynthesis protein TtcA